MEEVGRAAAVVEGERGRVLIPIRIREGEGLATRSLICGDGLSRCWRFL